MNKNSHFILGLLAQTPIHAGAQASTGVIDLPIQREGHSDLPCVFGSAIKGALRAHAEQHINDQERVVQAFGSKPDEQNTQAGALAISDARLLLLPVRSLTSHFKWVTCPHVLSRYLRDRELLSLESKTLKQLCADITFNDDEDVAFAPLSAQVRNTDTLFLEEYCYTMQPVDMDSLIDELSGLMQRDGVKEALQEQLIVVSNDAFSYLAKHATPVNAHIAIDSSTKIVRPGALWYEETLPPETLLYVPVMANAGRAQESAENLDAFAIASVVSDLFREQQSAWLQIGGNETVGMGWCAVAMEGFHEK